MILNRQRAVRVSIAALDRFLVRAQRKLRLRSDSLAVCLVTNAQMAHWNRSFRGKKGSTDVLSFPINGQTQRKVRFESTLPKRAGSTGDKGSRGSRGKNAPAWREPRATDARHGDGFSFASSTSSTSYLGDIAIAPVVARVNARRFGRTLNDELRMLILHGILHLMGYDHETDNGEMERREQRLRHTLGLA